RGEPDLLASCYRNSLKLAAAHGIRSIAFPSISTGIYGYPVEEAAKVALSVVASFLTAGNRLPDYIRFVLFDEATFAAYEKALLDLAP
ncbi:MAG: macro domain-containing protein, partial [Deltaproteobacteria bacterium]|nr:macro domain-containing protein [Deltaproteobacteria bacterium]